jgi:hypothetical protein
LAAPGQRNNAFQARDAANFWPLALLSFGESWHNSHHADPTCARHGVLRGPIDPSARLIWLFERLGWAHDVRWPTRAGWPRTGPAELVRICRLGPWSSAPFRLGEGRALRVRLQASKAR